MRVLMGFTGGQAWKLKNCCKEPTRANFLPETEEKADATWSGVHISIRVWVHPYAVL